MRPSDVELSRLAVAWGWLDQESFRWCLREADRCQAMGLEKGIDEILLERQRLSADQLRKLRRHLGWALERTRIGGFEIVRRIGVGGSGSVFEARHVRLNHRVALKVLYPRYARDKRMTGLFLREARALARLNHPHLVHAFDGGREGRYYYLAMEYVEGENLLQALARDGPLGVRRSVEIVEAVCGALSALEARRLVHRDIKPANILLTEDGGVKLTDLGLLKVRSDSGAPPTEWVCGTPHYLSPEQARGDGSEDTRSDIYSLAATWYHALAGRPPFVGASSREIMLAHSTREPPRLGQFRDDVPPAVERTILGWLSKNPELRPATSRSAMEELSRLNRSAGPRPRSRGVRGRRELVAASVLVICGLLALWLWSRGSTGSPAEDFPTRDTTVAGGRTESDEEERTATPAPLPEAETRGGDAPGGVIESLAPSTVEAALESRRLPESPSAAALSVTRPAPPSALPALARALGARAGTFATGVGRAWDDGRMWLERATRAARDRYEALRPLARGFHAGSIAVAPVGEDGVAVLLEYDFATRNELDDFRARPGSILLDGGDLVAVDEPFGTTMESIGWFAPPVRIRGEVSPRARITLGFGDLRISPWEGSGDRPGSRRAVPLPNARPVFELLLDRRGVHARAGDEERIDPAPVPRRGRLSVRLDSGRLRWLRIESRLDPTWAAERLRILVEPRSRTKAR